MVLILIVGAKGMLGSALMDVFADKAEGDTPLVTGWDRDEIDIVSLDEVREKVEELRPQVMINAAAYTDVDGAEENRALAHQVNEQGVRNLAIAAQSVGARLVHYSTDYVFPGDKPDGYVEDDSPGPAVNVYGESKLAGERALAEVRPEFYLIRTAWLYGLQGGNFVETMLKLAEDHRQLKVVGDQYGSPTFTKDVAWFTRMLLEENYPLGVYHAVNSGQASWFEFAQKIFEYSDKRLDVKPITTAEFPRPARRPAYSILKNTKGPEMRLWREALREYMDMRG